MIITVTLNPAIDQTLVLPRFVAGADGANDVFLGGVILTLSRGGVMEDALRLGIAADTACVLNPGTELCHRREVDILFPRVKVQPIASALAARN